MVVVDNAQDSDDDAMTSEDESEQEEDVVVVVPAAVTVPQRFALEMAAATTSTVPTTSSEEEVEEETTDNVKVKHVSLKQQEHETRVRELALMKDRNGGGAVTSAEDFERLVVSTPNDSKLWIQYMSYYCALTDIEAARDVATRALGKINFRSADEKLNIWTAWLNLEHAYGDDTSLAKVFTQALAANTPKSVYFALLSLYTKHSEWTEAAATLKTMRRKFKTSAAVWLASCQFELEQRKNHEGAATLFDASLKSLPTHKHLPVIQKFAGLEYEFGSHERARTIFDGMVASYPKRLDLWSVYLDKEIKFMQETDEDLGRIRGLFDRLVHMKFSSKKMKFLFKKYLAFENTHGSETSVSHVKSLVQAFVTSSLGEGHC